MAAARPKRSLSQNFLVDPNLRRKVVETLEAERGEVVLEIGAGHGELSALLVGRVARLVLVEKDEALAAGLAERWAERPEVAVVAGDALELDLARRVGGGGPLRVLSNVPYGITTPLIFRLLALRPLPVRYVLTVQREVAERIVALPGSRAYGALSVGVQIRAHARIAFALGRKAFRPVPAVDSAAVVLEPLKVRPEPDEEAALRELTRQAFGRRRKQLQRILRSLPEAPLSAPEAEAASRKIGSDPTARPETLSPAQFLALARLLLARSGAGAPD